MEELSRYLVYTAQRVAVVITKNAFHAFNYFNKYYNDDKDEVLGVQKIGVTNSMLGFIGDVRDAYAQKDCFDAWFTGPDGLGDATFDDLVKHAEKISGRIGVPLPIHSKNLNETQQKIVDTLDSLAKLLVEKNKRYGNAALQPLNVFSKNPSENSLLERIDDKIARIKNSDVLRKNDVSDLIGYLTLLCVNKGWIDFGDLVD